MVRDVGVVSGKFSFDPGGFCPESGFSMQLREKSIYETERSPPS
jgi:hypothetical protein